MGKQLRDQLRTGSAHGRPSTNTTSSKTRHSKTHLNVGSETLALLPLHGQAKLLAHLADLRSALSKVNPRRLALLSLIHISCQVIQQLWEKTETLLHIIATDSDRALSKDNLEKHFKYAGFGFMVTTIETWEKINDCLCKSEERWEHVWHFSVKSSDIPLTCQEPFVLGCLLKTALISIEFM